MLSSVESAQKPQAVEPSDQSFRAHLAALERSGDLVRFDKQVDPEQNMSAIEWKTYAQFGKSSLFTNIKGHGNWHACSQILADRKKWASGLGIPEENLLEEVGRRIRQPIAAQQVSATSAPVKQLIQLGENANLTDIPAAIVSDRDSGRYIPSGIAFMKDPETGIGNMSLHRQEVRGKDKTGFAMLPRHAWKIYEKYSQRGEPAPVAVVIGVHPAIWFAAGFTTAFGIDELELAGGLLNEPVRTVRCETIDVQVPADAEIVLEGELLPGHHLESEGPFGEVTGTYPEKMMAHVFRLKAITRRRDAIYYALHCGFPATDTQATTGLGIEIATREHLQKVDGGLDLLDVRLLTISGLLAIVIKMRPRTEGQAKIGLMAALSGPYQQPKLAIAVDDDIDVTDLRQIMWSIASRVRADRDVIFLPNAKVWALDNSSPLVSGGTGLQRVGTRWMIDATKGPLSNASERAKFDMALPKNFDNVDIKDFLPKGEFV
jgi:2,5-furandicarboxylate decarboxylase 1